MSIEGQIVTALSGLVGGRVYADVAPQTVTALPRLTYQQVTGDAVNFLDQATLPSKRNARMQISTWAASRMAAAALAQQVENALRAVGGLQVTVISGPVAVYESDTQLYGAHQDFSCWS